MGSNGKIALPKDGEGREIPLDVAFLYSASGESVKPYSFTFRRYDGFCWEMHLVGAPNLVYDPKSFYLTPPDSLEKLLDDMERAIHTPDPDTYASITCSYFDSANMDCAECERKHDICRETCNDAAWVDITARIHKLMVGEGK